MALAILKANFEVCRLSSLPDDRKIYFTYFDWKNDFGGSYTRKSSSMDEFLVVELNTVVNIVQFQRVTNGFDP
jgi:hypothetical protein